MVALRDRQDGYFSLQIVQPKLPVEAAAAVCRRARRRPTW